ncbi:MAG: hypothetical protein IJ667_03755 [Synergistaceae bacterium]|nr:hypothetical protein [Synergistaceae bacterium]
MVKPPIFKFHSKILLQLPPSKTLERRFLNLIKPPANKFSKTLERLYCLLSPPANKFSKTPERLLLHLPPPANRFSKTLERLAASFTTSS